ncbi:endonuclease/exonuclease/phosphatase family protein [Pseudohalocynthiibacter aestuariivivens]|uniref:endonuclease/exonuclease/phosphatase family protein n=1 Tax=Pseudohalocynthiibacter aestuariivivens TaxID=1591409 RepID=UPI001FEAFA3A|nr:endonuclease/exonuclease/phosphatase family protein [Pseudohalocynthiibacter aestuariivivens]
MIWWVTATACISDAIRVASFNTELNRAGPGLLFRDILRGDDTQIDAVVQVIIAVQPDVLLLQSFDYDFERQALKAFAALLGKQGKEYPYLFALRPNTGLQTGIDMNGDGRSGQPEDGQGYGRFSGQGGMALLSVFPILETEVRDFASFLWRDLPEALMPEVEGKPFPSEEAQQVQRLSSVAHWDVPIELSNSQTLHLFAYHATPPVFDGPEDRNGRRNHDETAFWQHYLDGALPERKTEAPFVILGDANLDPLDGDGRHAALSSLLKHHRIQDPAPTSAGGADAARKQSGVNDAHRGDPALDTVDWPDFTGRPGNLRVDYVLPSADLRVADSGVFWPLDDTLVTDASRHRLVWVDLEF